MDGDRQRRIGEGDESLRPALVLRQERGTESTPLVGTSDHAEREHPRIGRVGLDAQAPTNATVGGFNHGDVLLAVDRRRRPVAQQPLSGDDAHADDRLSLLVRKRRDRGSVLITGGPKKKAGRQAHKHSLNTRVRSTRLPLRRIRRGKGRGSLLPALSAAL